MFLKSKKLKVKESKKYKSFTLVELVVAIAIMIIIMVVLSMTFTTLVKSSIISNSLITARDESDFALRIFESAVKQSNVSGIVLFKTDNLRGYSFKESRIVNLVDNVTLSNGYSSSAFLPVAAVGNEIHLLPNGGDRWICLGFFKDIESGKGVILKTSSSYISGNNNHISCFNSESQEYKKNTILLNTQATNIKNFTVQYYDADNENSMILAEIIAEPSQWFGSGQKTEVIRQIVVTTRKLTSIY